MDIQKDQNLQNFWNLQIYNLQFNLQFEIYKTSETPFGILIKKLKKF